MDKILPSLKQEYARIIRDHNPSDRKEDGCLSEIDVLQAYFLLSDYFLRQKEEILFGMKSFDLFSSAVNRQFVEFGGEKKMENSLSAYGRTSLWNRQKSRA